MRISTEDLQVWIADDEDLIRKDMRRILAGREDVLIVGESASVRETVTALRTRSIDLVLLDVQMHGGSGFDVIAEAGPELTPAVIFVTAYDQHAIKAFEVRAMDYLLKPFDEERLNLSIDRAREQIFSKREGLSAHHIRALLSERAERWPERLAVRSGERIDLIPVELIDWIESANNCVLLHCGTRKHLMAETLTNLTAKLDPKRFVRVHRGCTVNVSRVVSVHPLFTGTYELELKGGFRITTGRQHRSSVLKMLAG